MRHDDDPAGGLPPVGSCSEDHAFADGYQIGRDDATDDAGKALLRVRGFGFTVARQARLGHGDPRDLDPVLAGWLSGVASELDGWERWWLQGWGFDSEAVALARRRRNQGYDGLPVGLRIDPTPLAPGWEDHDADRRRLTDSPYAFGVERGTCLVVAAVDKNLLGGVEEVVELCWGWSVDDYALLDCLTAAAGCWDVRAVPGTVPHAWLTATGSGQGERMRQLQQMYGLAEVIHQLHQLCLAQLPQREAGRLAAQFLRWVRQDYPWDCCPDEVR